MFKEFKSPLVKLFKMFKPPLAGPSDCQWFKMFKVFKIELLELLELLNSPPLGS